VLDVLRSHPLGKYSEVIVRLSTMAEYGHFNTAIGGRRIIDMPSGMQLPRIVKKLRYA